MTNLSEVMGIFSDILSKSRFEQRPIPGNFSPRPNPKKNTTKGTKPISLTKEFKPVPGTYNYRRDPDSTAKPKGKTAERELISDGATSDDATFVEGLEKAHMLKAFGVRKSTGGRHSLHPVERRPKTVTEKADGGEKYSSGARGKTSNYGLLGMIKALADGMSPERKKRIMDRLGNAASRYDEFSKKPENPKKSPQKELPFSTEDRDNIAPTPDPHGDTLSEPTQRGGGKQGSTRKGSIPREGWKEAALLYPAHRKDQQGGRKVKTRVGDSPTGYPT